MANEITKLQSGGKGTISPKNFNVYLEPDNNANHNDAILKCNKSSYYVFKNILKVHKKFLDENSSSNEELSPHNSPLPEKITQSATKPNSIKIPPMKPMNIPKLDLTQAKKIQEINAKKITPMPNMANVDPVFQEKYKR